MLSRNPNCANVFVLHRRQTSKALFQTLKANEFPIGILPSGCQTSLEKKGEKQTCSIRNSLLRHIKGEKMTVREENKEEAEKKENKDKLTVLTVTLKGVAAVDVGSMDGVLLSEDPGILRRRPVLSGGDSEQREDLTFGLRIVKTSVQ